MKEKEKKKKDKKNIPDGMHLRLEPTVPATHPSSLSFSVVVEPVVERDLASRGEGLAVTCCES
jgi:hypothetical protein